MKKNTIKLIAMDLDSQVEKLLKEFKIKCSENEFYNHIISTTDNVLRRGYNIIWTEKNIDRKLIEHQIDDLLNCKISMKCRL